MNAQTMTRVLLVCWCGVLSGVGTAWAQYAPESDTPPPPIRDGGTEVPARYYPDRTAQLNGPPGTSPVVAPAPTFGAPPAPLPAYDNPQPAYPIAAPGPVPRSPSDAIGAPLSEPVAAPTGPPVNFAAAPSIPRWVVGVDALWLERSIGDDTFLGANYWDHGFPAVHPDSLSSSDEMFPLSTGLRLQVGYRIDEQRIIEASYFGLQQWSTGRTIYGDPQGDTVMLYSPWTQTDSLIGGFNNTLSYNYGSRIDNFELNERIMLGTSTFGRSLAALWGFRYFHLSDNFTLTGTDLDTGDYENLQFRTNNNLIGLQGGFQWLRDFSRLELSTELKAGIFANLYQENGTNHNSSGVANGSPTGFIPFSESNQGTDVAGIFELSFMLRYALTEKLWLRAGYQAYWATGLALGPRQLNAPNHSGTVFLDGPSLGLEAVW